MRATPAPTPWTELEVLMKKDGWPSRTAFARELGTSLGHLSDLLSGRRNPTPAHIAKAAAILNVPKSMLEKRHAA